MEVASHEHWDRVNTCAGLNHFEYKRQLWRTYCRRTGACSNCGFIGCRASKCSQLPNKLCFLCINFVDDHEAANCPDAVLAIPWKDPKDECILVYYTNPRPNAGVVERRLPAGLTADGRFDYSQFEKSEASLQMPPVLHGESR